MSENTQSSAPSNRGRQNTRGTRRTNWGSPSRIKKAEQDQQKIQSDLDKNAERARNAPPRSNKVAQYIEEGKKLVSNFFNSFEEKERGNITVELDDRLTERISEPYIQRIEQQVQDEPNHTQAKEDKIVQRFVSGVTMATAVKLYQSSPELEKTQLSRLPFLHLTKFWLPEKLAVIVNQLGKTDLNNDNRLRLLSQGMTAKRMAVKSIVYYYDDGALNQLIPNAQALGLNAASLRNNIASENFDKMIDNSRAGLQALKDYGKQYFLDQSNRNHNVLINNAELINYANDQEISIKLPSFHFKSEGNSLADVSDYLNNHLFKLGGDQIFTFEQPNLVETIVASLVMQAAELSWLRAPDRTMQQLHTGFANSYIANVNFLTLMGGVGIWNINNYIDDVDLNDVIGDIIHGWNSNLVPFFRKCIKFKEISFSDFGTDSQLIEVENRTNDDEDVHHMAYAKIIGKPRSDTVLKTTESGALFGIMAKFNKKVRFRTGFTVNHKLTNRGILNEFLKSDFIG